MNGLSVKGTLVWSKVDSVESASRANCLVTGLNTSSRRWVWRLLPERLEYSRPTVPLLVTDNTGRAVLLGSATGALQVAPPSVDAVRFILGTFPAGVATVSAKAR